MGFNESFAAAFAVDDVQYLTVDLSTIPAVDQAERPQNPPYPKLWRRFRYPMAFVGLLLWKDGRVKQVTSFYDAEYLDCDDRILGGYQWFTTEDSWQAQVMADAGYTLVAYERPSA